MKETSPLPPEKEEDRIQGPVHLRRPDLILMILQEQQIAFLDSLRMQS